MLLQLMEKVEWQLEKHPKNRTAADLPNQR